MALTASITGIAASMSMAGLSTAIAALSFGVGYLIRVLFGVDV